MQKDSSVSAIYNNKKKLKNLIKNHLKKKTKKKRIEAREFWYESKEEYATQYAPNFYSYNLCETMNNTIPYHTINIYTQIHILLSY